jgi:hypothetical protein
MWPWPERPQAIPPEYAPQSPPSVEAKGPKIALYKKSKSLLAGSNPSQRGSSIRGMLAPSDRLSHLRAPLRIGKEGSYDVQPPQLGTTPHDTEKVPDFDIASGRVGSVGDWTVSITKLLEAPFREIDTVRERAKAAIAKSSSLLSLQIRRLVDANIIGIFIWKLEGHVLEANEMRSSRLYPSIRRNPSWQ